MIPSRVGNERGYCNRAFIIIAIKELWADPGVNINDNWTWSGNCRANHHSVALAGDAGMHKMRQVVGGHIGSEYVDGCNYSANLGVT